MNKVVQIGVGHNSCERLKGVIAAVTGEACETGSGHLGRCSRSVFMEAGARRPWKYTWSNPDPLQLDEVLNRLDLDDVWFEVWHEGQMLVNRLRWDNCRESYKHIDRDGNRAMLPLETRGAVQLTPVSIRGE